jgi:hypothetical protein
VARRLSKVTTRCCITRVVYTLTSYTWPDLNPMNPSHTVFLPSSHYLQVSWLKYVFLRIFHILHTCYMPGSLLVDDKYTLLSFSLCSFPHPCVTSQLWSTNILLNMLTNTLSLFSFHGEEPVFYIYIKQPVKLYTQARGCTNFPKKSTIHLKILSARRVAWSKFHTEDPQIIGATLQNLVARATWQQRFVHPCTSLCTHTS